VGEGVQGQVCPVLGGGARVDPWEGEATTRVSCQESPVIRGMTVEGGRVRRTDSTKGFTGQVTLP